jgi:SAM-dependent methyltransferase/tetratricopeptide (TPR) repeat protein
MSADPTRALLEKGLRLLKAGKLQEALNANQEVLALAPDHADALNNIGVILIQAGQPEKGLAFLEKSCAVGGNPTLAEQLGDSFYQGKNYAKAIHYYSKARQTRAADMKLQGKLALSLYRSGDMVRAAALYMDLVLRDPANRQYLLNLTGVYQQISHETYSDKSRNALLHCLKADGLPARKLRTPWSTLFMADPRFAPLQEQEHLSLGDLGEILDDPFLCLGLQKIPTLTADIELILTSLRKAFLLDWKNADAWPKSSLTFLTALATQCWYNDFVFYVTPEERAALPELFSALTNALAEKPQGDHVSRLFALYGCYEPLEKILPQGGEGTQKLPFAKGALYTLKPLIQAGIANPRRESELAASIPSFCPVTDDTSQAVRSMYERRPYPRWTSVNLASLPESIAEQSRGIEILVAGCGTGQEPAIYANALPHAHITGIDLSLSSLAYAKRMAEELEYGTRVDFLQGDLMEVSSLQKQFDFVTSSGVLHHLKEPEKGLAAILSTLKPGGRLSLSLYSQIARDTRLGPASAYIREKGYTSSDDDIRQFRHDILTLPSDDPRKKCAALGDFYSLSECNDLLFHVQEHRYTFLQVKALAEKFSLDLIHVSLNPDSLKLYNDMFPDANGAFDFERLDRFEQENPLAFMQMYKLYFCRKRDESQHPLDQVVRLGLI